MKGTGDNIFNGLKTKRQQLTMGPTKASKRITRNHLFRESVNNGREKGNTSKGLSRQTSLMQSTASSNKAYKIITVTNSKDNLKSKASPREKAFSKNLSMTMRQSNDTKPTLNLKNQNAEELQKVTGRNFSIICRCKSKKNRASRKRTLT